MCPGVMSLPGQHFPSCKAIESATTVLIIHKQLSTKQTENTSPDKIMKTFATTIITVLIVVAEGVYALPSTGTTPAGRTGPSARPSKVNQPIDQVSVKPLEPRLNHNEYSGAFFTK